jgi:hypothetical protein
MAERIPSVEVVRAIAESLLDILWCNDPSNAIASSPEHACRTHERECDADLQVNCLASSPPHFTRQAVGDGTQIVTAGWRTEIVEAIGVCRDITAKSLADLAVAMKGDPLLVKPLFTGEDLSVLRYAHETLPSNSQS